MLSLRKRGALTWIPLDPRPKDGWRVLSTESGEKPAYLAAGTNLFFFCILCSFTKIPLRKCQLKRTKKAQPESCDLTFLLFSRSVMSDSLRSRGLQHTAGFPVHQQLPEFAQTHVHRLSNAIQPSHPLSSLSPPAFNLSQHQGLFQ